MGLVWPCKIVCFGKEVDVCRRFCMIGTLSWVRCGRVWMVGVGGSGHV